MGQITLSPEEFTLVLFEADRIIELASEVAGRIGIDADVRIEVEEASAFAQAHLDSADPVVVSVQGGAFEDNKRPRKLSERSVVNVLGRLLYRAKDLRDPNFGQPPDEDDLTLAQTTAWDVYSMGRVERLGYEVAKQRWLYHFRNRHGFSDVADAAFDRLWSADGLTWADIKALCAETQEVKAGA